ncbi:MAG: exodeoxyribonuclease VII small subunit [Verrucomicrobiaceae bacterium]|nr:MAG: exodeoxyribonuclease VII small subunit [Verrucomicrobiaceae bacterium]
MAKQNPSSTPKAGPGFEEAISSLEAIVEAMEHDQLPLGELVEHYEKGTTLLNTCESLLNEAKSRIELITLRNQAEIGLETGNDPAHIPGPASAARSAADPDDDDDIRLF